MARNDQAAGPKIGQVVLYNSAGTIIPAIINLVNSTGTVGLLTFPSGTATAVNVNTASYSPNAGTTSTWGYPEFF
jgi:hypothetical protein